MNRVFTRNETQELIMVDARGAHSLEDDITNITKEMPATGRSSEEPSIKIPDDFARKKSFMSFGRAGSWFSLVFRPRKAAFKDRTTRDDLEEKYSEHTKNIQDEYSKLSQKEISDIVYLVVDKNLHLSDKGFWAGIYENITVTEDEEIQNAINNLFEEGESPFKDKFVKFLTKEVAALLEERSKATEFDKRIYEIPARYAFKAAIFLTILNQVIDVPYWGFPGGDDQSSISQSYSDSTGTTIDRRSEAEEKLPEIKTLSEDHASVHEELLAEQTAAVNAGEDTEFIDLKVAQSENYIAYLTAAEEQAQQAFDNGKYSDVIEIHTQLEPNKITYDHAIKKIDKKSEDAAEIEAKRQEKIGERLEETQPDVDSDRSADIEAQKTKQEADAAKIEAKRQEKLAEEQPEEKTEQQSAEDKAAEEQAAAEQAAAEQAAKDTEIAEKIAKQKQEDDAIEAKRQEKLAEEQPVNASFSSDSPTPSGAPLGTAVVTKKPDGSVQDVAISL